MSVRARQPAANKTPYERLRSAIIRGNISAGVRLVEQEVAERLSISRTPAREAIQRLYQDGFLTPVKAGPRTQFIVSPMTTDDMLDLYSIMAGLEGSAARNVARLDSAERKKLAKELRAADEHFVKVAKAPQHDFDHLFELHNAFHDALVDALASPRLRDLIARVRPQVDRYQYVYAPNVGPEYGDTFDEHQAIVRTIRDGSATSAEAAVRANWLNGGSRLAAAIEKAGPRGSW